MLKKTSWRESEENHQKELAKIKKPELFLSVHDVFLLVRAQRDQYREDNNMHGFNDMQKLWNDILSLPMFEDQKSPDNVTITWVPYSHLEPRDTFVGPYWSTQNPCKVTCAPGTIMCGDSNDLRYS